MSVCYAFYATWVRLSRTDSSVSQAVVSKGKLAYTNRYNFRFVPYKLANYGVIESWTQLDRIKHQLLAHCPILAQARMYT